MAAQYQAVDESMTPLNQSTDTNAKNPNKKKMVADTVLVQEESKKNSKSKTLNARELSDFCRQISTLLNSGVTIVRALSIISNSEDIKPKIAKIYQQVLADVRVGQSLFSAMEEQGVFPNLMLGMIQAGEGNGRLGKSFEQLANHYEKQYQMEKQVKAAMTYPVILIILAIAVVIIIFTFVLPQFSDMFAEMDTIPAITRALMAFSDFLIHRWYVVIAAVVLLAFVVRTLASSPAISFLLDKAKVKMPMIGKLNQVVYTARFARSLSSLYSSGMTIVAALQISRFTIGNKYIAAQFDQVLADVRGGAPLSSALQKVDGFKQKLFSIIQVGEETGAMDTMLDSIADSMEYDAQEASKQILSILEPLMIVIMAVVIGGIVIAVMLPIIQSYGAIEGSANL